MTGKINDMTENMKNNGEIFALVLPQDNNLYLYVWIMSKITSTKVQIDVRKGTAVLNAAQNRQKWSLAL